MSCNLVKDACNSRVQFMCVRKQHGRQFSTFNRKTFIYLRSNEYGEGLSFVKRLLEEGD